MAEVNTNQVSSIKNTLYSMVNSVGKVRGGDMAQASSMRATSPSNTDESHTRSDLVHTAREINKKMEHIGADINFSYNDDIGGLVVTVKDPTNGDKVIREIPSKEAIELTKKMHEAVGLIFDKRG